MSRIESADPDALTAIYFLLLCAVPVAIYLIARHKTRKRNRWIDPPRPDDRSSIEQFKRMNTP